MAEYCTLDPAHADVELDTPKEQRQGFCDECAQRVAAEPKIADKNARAVARQAAKDQFMADHPEMWTGGKVGAGSFVGEGAWLAYEAGEEG